MGIKKVFSVLLVLVLSIALLPTAKASTSSEKEKKYNEALNELESFLQSPSDAASDHLTGIIAAFEALDKFKYSEELRRYAYIMRNVMDDDYEDWYTEMYLDQLAKNKKFDAYIRELSDSPLCGIREMTDYYKGRMAEHADDTDLAMQYYDNCSSFFDTMNRQVKLTAKKYAKTYKMGEQMMEKKEYLKAYEYFIQCGTYKDAQICIEYIIGILGYEPGKCNDTHTWDEGTVTLQATCNDDGEIRYTCTECGLEETKPIPATNEHDWQKSSKDASMKCRVCGKTEESTTEKKTTASTKATPVPSIKLKVEVKIGYNTLSWNAVSGASTYTVRRHKTNGNYEDIATTKETKYKDSKVSGGYKYYYTVRANFSKSNGINSNEVVKIAATPKPTATTTITPKPEPTTVKEYRYRDSSTGYTNWSEWSDWSSSTITVSNAKLMEVEEKVRHKWWAARCLDCSTNNPHWDIKCKNCGQSLSKNRTDFLHVNKYTDTKGGTQTRYGRSGAAIVDGEWVWYEKPVTHYRSRTREETTVWSAWSEWSSSKPASQSNRKIESRERTVTK